ncbi:MULTISPECIES: nucleotidyltransferase family protein [Fulvivirga]|uniref:Nucleotidyltransferase family protein n=1 Tax=Fulvivirga lutea TaxID=2810512 RepID=A0A975A247_9BACT|nr:nucleotidyltransferase family protein [Fulvivirga lutea]QSE99051.1 nucleotidyltransferase family protein [Fulvivirga lutea]
MRSTAEILNQLKDLKVGLMKTYPIASMALFGSFARSEQTPESDIDILVELNGQVGSKFIDLAEELELSLGKKVDLVSKKGIKPHYFKSIQSDLIYV